MNDFVGNILQNTF